MYAALQAFDPNGTLLGGMYVERDKSGETGPGSLSNAVFWPPPVFTPDGKAYTFGADGLIEVTITVAAPAASP